MEIPGSVTIGEAARMCAAVLDRVDLGRVALLAPGEVLAAAVEWARLADRAAAGKATLMAEAVRTQASEQAAGTPLRSWWQQATQSSARQAGAAVRRSADLDRFRLVRAALVDGRVSAEQADVICAGLRHLPDDMTVEQIEHGERHLLGLATGDGEGRDGVPMDPDGLRRCANRLVEVIAPEVADEELAKRLAREAAKAERDRHFGWRHDHHGSVWFSGQLPVADAEDVIAVLTAHVNAAVAAAKAADRSDPLSRPVTLGQRRADALMTVFGRAAGQPDTPTTGGMPPTVHVQLSHAALLAGLRGAGLIGPGEDLEAGKARRMACDAHLIPSVLGSEGEILDHGRSVRLVPPRLRALLITRDGGCAFPGCDRPPADCEAHHIRPWWAGGPTSLNNLVLLCRHHHRVVEPVPNAPAGLHWEVRLNATDHKPEFLPPTRLDRTRRPQRHTRHTKITIPDPATGAGARPEPHRTTEPHRMTGAGEPTEPGQPRQRGRAAAGGGDPGSCAADDRGP
ncbi:DUF222 domain-containing protein [Propionibacteriaceae bacterium Y2011]